MDKKPYVAPVAQFHQIRPTSVIATSQNVGTETMDTVDTGYQGGGLWTLLLCLLAAPALTTSCSQDSAVLPQPVTQAAVTTITLTQPDADTRATVDDLGAYLSPVTWEAGDRVVLYNHDATSSATLTKYTFTCTDAEQGTFAYQGTIAPEHEGKLAAVYNMKVSYSSGHICLTPEHLQSTLAKDVVTLYGLQEAQTGTYRMQAFGSILKYNQSFHDTYTGYIKTSATIPHYFSHYEQGTADATRDNFDAATSTEKSQADEVRLPRGINYIHMPVGQSKAFGIGRLSDFEVQPRQTSHGRLYTLGVTLIPYSFSVSAGADGQPGTSDDKHVLFTSSNIWWDGSNLHFEAKPYTHEMSRNSSHIAHFYWTRTAQASYAWDYSEANPSATDKLWCGEDSPITVDGVTGLYALTADEWKYLINDRPNAIKSFTDCYVSNCYCLVLAPDDHDIEAQPLKDKYTMDEIYQQGLLCLPRTGKNTPEMFHVNGEAEYWTATPVDAEKAYSFSFPTLPFVRDNQTRNCGFAIRLVRNVN